jgi:SAM-dependent methyltransferase
MTDASFVVADVDRAALSRVPRGGRLFPVFLAPGQPLPFADGAFDAVLAVDVLHHVPEPEALAAELVRSLRPEGRLLAVEFDGRRPWARLLRRILRAEGRECRPWDPDTLRTTLGRAGFDARPEPLDSLRFLVEALTSPGPGSP